MTITLRSNKSVPLTFVEADGNISDLNGRLATVEGSFVNSVNSVSPTNKAIVLTTANIDEGTNLYYTDTRVRAAVSVTDAGGDGSLAFNSSTGVFTYTGPSAAEVRTHISVTDAGGDGSLAYNSSTGVITYTGPSLAEVKSRLNSSSINELSDVSISGTPTANHVLTFNSSTSKFEPASPPGATGGEANTATNLGGSGASIFTSKVGVDFKLRKIIGGTGISATENSNDITLAVAATPSFTGIKIADGGNIGSVSDADSIAISAAGVVTMNQIPVFSAGINVSGGTIAGTLATVAQGNITSVGTLTALSVDNININGNNITSTNTDGDILISPNGGGRVDVGTSIIENVTDPTAAQHAATKSYVDSAVSSLSADKIIEGNTSVETIDAGTGSIVMKVDNVAELTIISATATFGTNIVIPDAGTIGSATDVDAIQIGSDGDVTLSQDLELQHDAATISFGADDDVVLTHVADTGLLLNAAMVVQFRDAAINIGSPADGDLDINADDEIELNSTLIDINGNVEISGTLAQADTVTMATNKKIQFRDTAIHISSTADGDLSIAADDEIDITSTLIDINGNVTISGTTGAAAVTTSTIVASGIIKTDDTTAATSTTDGSLQTDGGLSVALDAVIGDDLFMLSDAAVITFGAGKDVTLTHVHDTGILLNSTMAIQFNDASQFINAPSNAILDINATDEIELNATLVDINANVEISGNLTVSGTTIQVDTITMNAANAIIFEGATADTSETTLTIVDPTADRTINLPDQSGTVAVLAAASNVAITSTPAELNKLDGATVVVGEINALDLGSTAIGIGIASKAVVLDTAKDYTGIRNLTITGEIDAATGDFSGVVDVAGATTTAAITASGIIKTDDTTNATTATDGSLQTDGGLSVVLDAVFGDDVKLLSDASVLSFGTNSDITVTHVHDTGLTITNVIADTDNRPIRFQLKSEEDAIVADDVIATIEFAAGDSDGTDGAVVAAGIHAIAEDTFSASANATKLVFTTGVSETAAAGATAKMTLSSAGLLTLADDLVLKNSATIGAGNDTDLLTLGNGNLTVAGTVTATAGATLLIKNAAGTTLKTIKGMT